MGSNLCCKVEPPLIRGLVVTAHDVWRGTNVRILLFLSAFCPEWLVVSKRHGNNHRGDCCHWTCHRRKRTLGWFYWLVLIRCESTAMADAGGVGWVRTNPTPPRHGWFYWLVLIRCDSAVKHGSEWWCPTLCCLLLRSLPAERADLNT